MKKPESGVLGWVAIGSYALVYDIYVMRKGKQSLSGALWAHGKHPFYGPAIAGFWAALTWHFFFDKP